MLNKSLAAAALSGVIGLAGPAFAQSGESEAYVEKNVIVAPAGEVPTERAYDRVVESNGTIVETRRVTDVDGTIRVYRRVSEPRPLGFGYSAHLAWAGRMNGAVGGAIGGRYINGTTPADNKPLPGGPWPVD